MRSLLLVLMFLFPLSAYAELVNQSAPKEARVYFISPADGATVSSPFIVRFGLKGLGVAPAGTNNPKTGHHHLLIDLEELPVTSSPLPATEQIRHFGGGQTEAEVSLPKGKHTLQLLVGDHMHLPHDPPIASKKITITVQ